MVTLIAAFVLAKRVVLAELLGVVFLCVALAHFVGRAGVFAVLAIACLAKAFEWDLSRTGDG